ncbi:uncharacterized protein F4812DRAFT_471554 [Daldinia caldariorum]|uniref:uncharacterized protein n=1 Tax=Daldinia caldariorum TaxID=326644 RepID=UPI0020080852|nr:uncharacterized protein F4812DRAFT_471554 [Daldinia caldariorum]KAI1467569.1 hypothetical protein F4812DRAFT_471554 [Daldinia caldariorum]
MATTKGKTCLGAYLCLYEPCESVNDLDVVEHYNQSKSREAFDVRDIVDILRHMDHQTHIDILRESLAQAEDKDSPQPDREAYLRTKIRQELRKYFFPAIYRLHGDTEFHSHSTIEELVEVTLQISAGINTTWYPDNRYPLVLRKFGKAPSPPHLETFHQFTQLSAEVRAMIWEYAVTGQNRVVSTYRLRKVTRAPCPVLFLVCKEALFWAIKKYKRVRNGDLLYGSIMPGYFKATGPVISFEDDIVNIGDWDAWNNNKGSKCYVTDIYNRRAAGQGLQQIHQRIEKLSKIGFRRVVVDKNTHVHPEMLFYKNSRKILTTFKNLNNLRSDWCWKWTDKIEEIWQSDEILNRVDSTCRTHFVRIFPPLPGNECQCSLCLRADLNIGVKVLPYNKPEPGDIEEHERIFNRVEPHRFWNGTGLGRDSPFHHFLAQ